MSDWVERAIEEIETDRDSGHMTEAEYNIAYKDILEEAELEGYFDEG